MTWQIRDSAIFPWSLKQEKQEEEEEQDMGQWSMRTSDSDDAHDLLVNLAPKKGRALARGLESVIRDGRSGLEVAGAALVLVDSGKGGALSSALVAWSVARLRLELQALELERWRDPDERQRQVLREIRALQALLRVPSGK